jgi:hypothetical protein
MRIITSLMILFFLGAVNIKIKAQENEFLKNNPYLEWTLEEKFKFKPEQLLEIKSNENYTPAEQQAIQKFKATMAAGELDITGHLNTGDELEAEIHAAINPTDSNNIVISPIRQDMAAGGINCPIYYTTDFGETWSMSDYVNMPYTTANGEMSGGGGDPVFAFDADGKLYFTWIDLYGTMMDMLFGTVNMGIFWSYSDDGGATWVKPARDTVLLGEMQMTMGQPSAINAPISDKQWMAVDRTVGDFRNNLYISYVTIGSDGANGSTYQILCSTKPADEDYFTTETAVSNPDSMSFVQFSSLGVDKQGNVHVIFYGLKDIEHIYGIWHSVSTDGGVSFSDPNLVSEIRFNLPILEQLDATITETDTIPGITGQRTYPSPYMGADMNNGNIYVTWTAFGVDALSSTSSDIYFSMSDDNGATWSTPMIVNDDASTAHNYYSSIFVKDNGDVKVSWYDRRDDPDPATGVQTHYYYATSEDNGMSFGENKAATTVPMDFSAIGSQNQGFAVGEYTQILASDTYTIPVWCDGRTNDGNVNVYVAFYNDLATGEVKVSSVTDQFNVTEVYPNPASTQASMDVTLKSNSNVNIQVVDITGKQVANIMNENFTEGKHKLSFGVEDIANGQYYVVVTTDFGYVAKPITINK